MNLWQYTARESQRRPARTLLTLVGISLGLATVVATRLTIPTVEQTYRELFEGMAGQPSLEVTAPGQAGFDPGFARELASVAGARSAVPRIRGVVSVVGQHSSAAAPVLGIDPARLAAVTEWRVRDGAALAGDNDALLDAGLAEALGLKAGDVMRLWAPEGLTELRLAGTLEPRGPGAALGGVLVVSLHRAQGLFALPGQVNSVEVLLADGADAESVRAEVAGRLPAGVAVQPPGARGGVAQSTLRATKYGLAALGTLALTAGAFVILNTFLLNLGERRRQLAILRALGATRAQVRRLLLREALLLGLVGTAAGCVGGLALAVGLLHVLGKFLSVGLPGPHLAAGPFVLAAVLGPASAVAAAWVPAWCASRREPLDDLLAQRGRPGDRLSCRVWQAGLLLLGLGALLGTGLCRGWLPASACPSLLAPALALLLIGCVLTLPALAAPLLRLAAALPLGLVGRLAALQLARQRARTGLTAGVLFLALAVAIGFGHCLRAILADLRHWCRQTITADFLVRGSMPDTSFVLAAALPDELTHEMRQQDGVAAVDRVAWLPAQADGVPVLVLARDFAADRPLPLDLREGDADAVRAGLLAGEAVLSTALAQQLGLHRGDRFTLETPHGPRQVRVAGTATEYAAGGSALYVEWHAAARLLPRTGVNVFLVSARPGGAVALGPVLQDFCDRHHLLLQSNAQFGEMIDQLLARVTGLLWALMALVFVLASLGIVNTLTMNVHEQKRELGVLRALGLKRGQVRRLVLAQALLLGSIGLVPGAVAGVVLAYLIDRGTSWVGPPIAFQLDGLVVAGCCALALVIALVAALLPGRHAARLPVLGALADA